MRRQIETISIKILEDHSFEEDKILPFTSLGIGQQPITVNTDKLFHAIKEHEGPVTLHFDKEDNSYTLGHPYDW